MTPHPDSPDIPTTPTPNGHRLQPVRWDAYSPPARWVARGTVWDRQ